MRDIVLALVIAALLPMAFKRPWVGALMFAWVSIMNPHKMAWGFAHNFPWAQIIAIVTLLGFLMARSERKVFPWSGVTVVYGLLMVWMSVTSVFAMADMAWVQGRLIFVMKIHLMILVTLMLLRERKQIELLVWVMVGSIGFFGVKGGAFTIAKGGAARVWGPPGGMIEENNALAVALVMMMPLIFYLFYTQKRRWARYTLGFCMAMMAFSILGSQSRGALLALFAMAALLGLKSNHPVRASIVIAVFVAMVVAFMPDSWSDRMDTIKAYQSDTSAMSRIYTWWTIWNLSMDRPLLGAGFGTDTLTVFRLYAPTEPPYDIFTGRVFVAHSIYLQALGEHGFPGLVLYLLLALMTWRMASRTSKLTKNDPEFGEWVPLLMRMSQVSLVGFAVGGAFLTLMHLDVTYYIMALVLLTHATVRESQAAKALASRAQPGPVAVPVPATVAAAATVPGRTWPGMRT